MSPEPFSHEDFMEGGAKVLDIFDAMKNEDVQAIMLEARASIDKLATVLRDEHGFDNRTVAQTLMGFVFGPILPD